MWSSACPKPRVSKWQSWDCGPGSLILWPVAFPLTHHYFPPKQHFQIGSVLIYQDCHNRVPQTGRLKQQGFTVSQFWRLGVRGDGVGRAGFSEAPLSGFASGWLLCVSSHGLLSVSQSPLRTTFIADSALVIRPHFHFIISFKPQFPSTVPF